METYQSEALCARKKSHNHAHINALETTGVSTLFMAWTLACHCIQHKLKELWLHCLSGLLSKDLWWYGRHGWHHYACWHWGIWCKHLAGHWLLLHGFGWLMLGYLGHGCLWHGCSSRRASRRAARCARLPSQHGGQLWRAFGMCKLGMVTINLLY